MRPPTLSLFALLPLTGALSWKHTSLWKRDASNTASEIGDGLAPDELALILQGSDALERYSAKQDCFRKASSLIRARCVELETREDERVKAALSMTLCEIATAENYSPPMECAPFQPGYDDRRHVPSASSHGKCVEALSRSAQYWSSYSGYLREVPQLCFAYRRWNDIDTAKELHRNSTLQSLHLLNHLAERERRFTSSHQQSSVLVQEMQSLLGQLHSSSAAINIASNDIPEQLRLVINEIRHTFTDTIMNLREGMAHAHTAELIEMQSSIARLLSDIDIATSAVVPTLERSLLQAFERLISSVESRIWGLNTLADRVGSQFGEVEGGIQGLQQDVSGLVEGVQGASETFAMMLQESRMAHEKQLEIAHAANEVGSALEELTERMHVEIQQINGTASALEESLLRAGSRDWNMMAWSWLETMSVYCFKYIWRDPTYLDTPAVRVALLFSRVLWSFMTLASSGLMSVLVLLVSRQGLFTRSMRVEPLGDDDFRTPSDARPTRLRLTGSLATTAPCGSDDAIPGFLGADCGHVSSASRTCHHRRPRISRIPARLYRPSND